MADRIRIAYHLPINDAAEAHAASDAISILKGKRKTGVKGFTHSVVNMPVFRGYWWSSKRQRWVPDRIVVCYTDVLAGDDAAIDLPGQLAEEINKLYVSYTGQPQAEIWIVSHPVDQYKKPKAP